MKTIFMLMPLLLSFKCLLYCQTICDSIDFESVPGEIVDEGLIIGDQFLEGYGISFSLEDGTLPRIAKVGSPDTGFQSQFGDDTPAPNQGVLSFFLTDDGVAASSNPPPLIASFTNPIDSASGIILDIDANEMFTIQALDESSNILYDTIIFAGDNLTGDGIATPWSIRRETPDVHAIRFIGERPSFGFGLGFDNFIACGATGLTSSEEVLERNYKLYPNPSYGLIFLELYDEKIERFEIIDVSGRTLHIQKTSNRDKFEILINSEGIVFLKLIFENGVFVEKLLISK